jgi:hypothetical protein
MDDATKNMIMSLAAGAVKKVLISGGALLAGHGIAVGFSTAEYAGASVAIVAAGYSFWNDYGRAIITSQVEVLKARSLAAAKKIQDARLPPVTVSEIAAQSPTLTEAQVTKVSATLPPAVAASVVPLAKTG